MEKMIIELEAKINNTINRKILFQNIYAMSATLFLIALIIIFCAK